MTTAQLLYGRGTRTLELADSSDVTVIQPRALPPVPDAAREIERALSDPIGSPPLHTIARGRSDAMLLVCDLTRDVPDDVIVPRLLDELNAAGIPDRRIALMVAGGAHRRITSFEAKQRFGDNVLDRVELLHHDASDRQSHVYVGTTSDGTPVRIDRRVAESDLVLATGCIIPHTIAGYGGGRKLIVPGVASAETIRRNHRPTNVAHPSVGFCRTHGNVIHEELMEAARMARLDFIVNVIWSPNGDLVQAVAGDMEKAWEAGVQVADSMYSVPLDRAFDLLVTSGGGAPADVNLYQAFRGLQVGVPAARSGGVIVLVAECTEGVGSAPLYEWLRDADRPEDVVARRDRGDFDIHGEHIACYLCSYVFPRYTVILVSSLPASQVEEMMMVPAPTVAAAVEQAVERLGSEVPSILVNPYGAKAVPRLERMEP